jgi:O-antigen/teichoic acid export membrane protein
VLDRGLRGLIAAQVVVWPLIAMLHFGVMARVVGLRRTVHISAETRRRMIRSTITLTASSTLGLVVFTRSAVFMLGYFATTSDVAYYSIAFAMAEALQVALPLALAFAVMPNISRAFADGDIEFARRVYEGQLRLTALMVAPVAVAGAVLSHAVILVFYGDAFEEASGALAVLLFAAGLRSLAFCATWVLVGSDRERLVVWIYAGAVVVNIGLGLALIPSFGVAGAVGAEAATQLFLAAAAVTVVQRTFR